MNKVNLIILIDNDNIIVRMASNKEGRCINI